MFPPRILERSEHYLECVGSEHPRLAEWTFYCTIHFLSSCVNVWGLEDNTVAFWCFFAHFCSMCYLQIFSPSLYPLSFHPIQRVFHRPSVFNFDDFQCLQSFLWIMLLVWSLEISLPGPRSQIFLLAFLPQSVFYFYVSRWNRWSIWSLCFHQVWGFGV